MPAGFAARRLAVLVAAALMVLVAAGRFALESWLDRPAPDELPEIGARTDKASPLLFVILDGLNETSAFTHPNGAMPRMAALAAEGASGIAETGEPTLTAPCVRALLTGRRPDLLTGFRNFDAPPVGGSIVEYLARRGAHTAHAGDAAAWQIAPAWYLAKDVYAVPDRGPVDQGETDAVAVEFILERMGEGANVLTLHLTRIDHAGHKHGARSVAYTEACQIVDGQVARVVDAFRGFHPQGTVLVASDHGVSAMGTHGGGESAARRAPWLLVGPRVAMRRGVEVDQSALAPTLCALLGLPQPPLADAPPQLDLLELSPEEGDGALRAWLEARLRIAHTVAGARADRVAVQSAALGVERLAASSPEFAALRQELDKLLAPDRTVLGMFATLVLALGLAVLVAAGTPTPARAATAGPRWSLALLLFVPTPLLLGAAPDAFVPATPLALSIAVCLLAAAAWRLRPTMALASASCAALLLVSVFAGAAFMMQEAMATPGPPEAPRERALAAACVLLALGVWFLRTRTVRSRIAAFVDRHPMAAIALVGAPLGFATTLRPFIDNVVHTVVLYAVLAAGVVALWLRSPEGRAAPRHAVAVVGGVAALLFVVLRLLEGLVWERAWVEVFPPFHVGSLALGVVATFCVVAFGLSTSEARRALSHGGWMVLLPSAVALLLAYVHRLGWLLDRPAAWGIAVGVGANIMGLAALFAAARSRTPPDIRLLACVLAGVALARRASVTDGEHLAYALVALAAMAAGRFHLPQGHRRLVCWALGLLVLRVGVFHAMGFVESFSTLDVGQAFAGLGGASALTVADAAAGASVTWQVVVAGLQLTLRMALPWILFLAALRRALDREPARQLAPLRAILGGVVVGFAARAAVIVAAVWALHHNTWWMSHAYTVYAFAVADILLLAVVGALMGAFSWSRGDVAKRPAPLRAARVGSPA